MDKQSKKTDAFVEETEPVELAIEDGVVKFAQLDELKRLIDDNRTFTQQVHDAIVERLATLEGKVFKLGSTVSGIRGAERKFPRTKEYTVAPGDKLTGIAKKQLGQAGRFTEIAILNYDRYPSLKTNPDHIREGWKLRLPA